MLFPTDRSSGSGSEPESKTETESIESESEWWIKGQKPAIAMRPSQARFASCLGEALEW